MAQSLMAPMLMLVLFQGPCPLDSGYSVLLKGGWDRKKLSNANVGAGLCVWTICTPGCRKGTSTKVHIPQFRNPSMWYVSLAWLLKVSYLQLQPGIGLRVGPPEGRRD